MKDKTFDKLHKAYSTPGHTPFSSTDHIMGSHLLNLKTPIQIAPDYETQRILAKIKAMDDPRCAEIMWLQAKQGKKSGLWQVMYWIAIIGLVYSIWEIM